MIRKNSLYIISFIVSIFLILSSDIISDDDPTLRDHVYLVVFEPGPAWIEGKPVSEQNLREHGGFWLDRYEEGIMIQAGPFTDDSGGAVIFRAENMETAQELIANDPAILSEQFIAIIHPWRWVEWDYHLERRNR